MGPVPSVFGPPASLEIVMAYGCSSSCKQLGSSESLSNCSYGWRGFGLLFLPATDFGLGLGLGTGHSRSGAPREGLWKRSSPAGHPGVPSLDSCCRSRAVDGREVRDRRRLKVVHAQLPAVDEQRRS
jgi:hypothetical protein